MGFATSDQKLQTFSVGIISTQIKKKKFGKKLLFLGTFWGKIWGGNMGKGFFEKIGIHQSLDIHLSRTMKISEKTYDAILRNCVSNKHTYGWVGVRTGKT